MAGGFNKGKKKIFVLVKFSVRQHLTSSASCVTGKSNVFFHRRVFRMKDSLVFQFFFFPSSTSKVQTTEAIEVMIVYCCYKK